MLLLPRRRKSDRLTCHHLQQLLPSLLSLVALTLVCIQMLNVVSAQSFSDTPPRYSYDKLPKTGFTCQGKLPGRYYPDPETDCQMFHVCVKMNNRDTQDFKFLCPNGTVFDSEHQVCIDYYQVVCHSEVGTNPLGQIFEIFKISSGQGNRDLDSTKLSLVNPDAIDRNTLGDDFQVEEHNTNRLASSQNSLGFRGSQPAPSSKRTKSNKAKEDIFFNNKGFVPSTNFGSYQEPSTTRRPVFSTTTTTTTTEAPGSSTPRRPSLETFESYETESFSGFIPARNDFGRGQSPPPDFDASVEEFSPKDVSPDDFPVRTTERSTTARPFVFQNTFRTTLSHLPSTSRPSAQTFQQQAKRFNDDYFTRLPSSTKRPVSKAAQFFIHSTTADDYFTPEYRQPTVNPFLQNQRPRSTTTTVRPNVVFQSNSGTVRPRFNGGSTTTDFRYETTTPTPTITTTTRFPTTTRRNVEEFEARQTTTYNSDFTRNSNFFSVANNNNNDKPLKEEFGGKASFSSQRQFPPQISSQFVEEETLRPRSIHGVSNSQVLNRQTPRDNFGFSTVPPPTTAEPASSTTPPPTTVPSTEVTQQETAQTLATRLQSQLFKKIATTKKDPERFSIFFGRSTPAVGEDRLPSPGPTTVLYYDNQSTSKRPIRTRSTTASPFDFQTTATPEYDRRGRLGRLGSAPSTIAPEDSSSSSRPLRRGVRRRVRPGRPRQPVKTFDPQLKYTRKRFNDDIGPRNDEIFNAEASVFRGDPSLNNYHQDEKRKGSGKAPEHQQRQRQPVNNPEQFYGRRVRLGGNPNNGSVPANNINNGEGAPVQGPQLRRRVVKRIRPKTTTPEPGSVPDGTTPKKQFVVTGSTIRPVTRINVKTKLGGKISTTFRTTEITDGSSQAYGLTEPSTALSSSTTTEEPELVTASDDEIAARRQHNQQQSTTTSQKPSLLGHKKQFSNDSHLVIKVLNEKPPPPAPLSFKKILADKKTGKPGGAVKPTTPTNVETKKNNTTEEESNTRSPDYDYAYYNSDDGTDYDAETGKIDHKNYGNKPTNA